MKTLVTPEEALAHAMQTARFVDRRETSDGKWALTPDDGAGSPLDLYHGAAGIALFQLELAAATGDARYLEAAHRAGTRLTRDLAAKSWASVAFATGWPGYAFVLHELARATDTRAYQAASSECIDRLLAQASSMQSSAGAGLAWIEPMPFSDITGFKGDREILDLSVGAAGAGLTMCHLDRTDDAVRVANRLLDVAEHHPEGRTWGLMSDMPFAFRAPNFAHGGAGVGYFMARLFEATSDPRFLDAAMSAANYVVARMTAIGDGTGCLVCHTEDQQPPHYYLGSCHGPAGTGRLFALLARLTSDMKWMNYVDALLNGAIALGAPETRSRGWWNNYSQCCGDAGLGEFALLLWEQTHADRYLELASDCVQSIASNAIVEGDTRYWLQAEHRARPKFVQAQSGYMQGAAGIGSFLLHYATAQTRNDVHIRFPDQVL